MTSNPVVAVMGMSLESFTPDEKYLWSVEYGVRVILLSIGVATAKLLVRNGSAHPSTQWDL